MAQLVNDLNDLPTNRQRMWDKDRFGTGNKSPQIWAIVVLPLPGGPYKKSEVPAFKAAPTRRSKFGGKIKSFKAALTLVGLIVSTLAY